MAVGVTDGDNVLMKAALVDEGVCRSGVVQVGGGVEVQLSVESGVGGGVCVLLLVGATGTVLEADGLQVAEGVEVQLGVESGVGGGVCVLLLVGATDTVLEADGL